jgi:hypothetical protein
MSCRQAPLYIEAWDLARSILDQIETSTAPNRRSSLCERTLGAALDLLDNVSLALTFPAGRPGYLLAADESVVKLRLLLRLSLERAHLPRGAGRVALERLLQIGRMIGGWRKQVGTSGAESPSAMSARSAAVASTTTRGTRVPPTATGTTRGTGTTTSVSGSCSPRPPARGRDETRRLRADLAPAGD